MVYRRHSFPLRRLVFFLRYPYPASLRSIEANLACLTWSIKGVIQSPTLGARMPHSENVYPPPATYSASDQHPMTGIVTIFQSRWG